jgi:hypothetical protein
VVAAVVVVLSIVPVYFAQRLTSAVDTRSAPEEPFAVAATAASAAAAGSQPF